jgi:hypothetical protein
MAATTMNRLRIAKQTLLLESELNRLALAEDLIRLQRHVPWPMGGPAESGGPSGWLRLLPLAGSFAAGGFVGKRPWMRKLALALQVAAVVFPLVRKFNAKEEEPLPEAKPQVPAEPTKAPAPPSA